MFPDSVGRDCSLLQPPMQPWAETSTLCWPTSGPVFFFYINMVESFRMAMVNLLWEKTRTRLVDTMLPF